jgi:hypothetical protein
LCAEHTNSKANADNKVFGETHLIPVIFVAGSGHAAISFSSTDSTNASSTLLMILSRPSASKAPDYKCNENKIPVPLRMSH